MPRSGHWTKDNPPPTKGCALLANRTPARSASPVMRQLFALMDEDAVPRAEAARRMGKHRRTLENWKNGFTTPDLVDFELAAQALGYRLVLERVSSPSRDN